MNEAVTEANLIAGAQELVHTCLAIGAADRVLVLTDLATEKLADYIVRAASAIAGTTKVLVGDVDTDFVAAFATIEGALDAFRPTVTVFAARDSGDLLAWEPRFGQKLEVLGARHAQMPALDSISLGIGMAADYREVATFSKAVRQRLAGTREVSISNALGTDILFTLDPQRPWIPLTGLYHSAGQRGRLPQGEVFCSPLSADGVIAASVLGYPFNAATGLLAQPVRFEIEKGRLADLSHPDADLAASLRDWFRRDEHAGRIGELAVGTNRGSTALCGNLLFDENVPGCHIALGHPFGDWTGAEWHSSVHVDLVVDRPTIVLDGQMLIVDGAYVDAPSLSVPIQRDEKRL
ncbi:aminopeptidase [Mesorhizobium sp. VNQ89]|uniref:aminopeptidase n=1 Tax=Mesorhizobium quangtriensis TaxID=3157709 RepID=UPI0032B81169